MKKAILILLMLVLPLQAFAAAERNLAHLLGGQHDLQFALKHIAEHAGMVLHHHGHDEDNDDAHDCTTHVDQSQKSAQHLAEYEHGCSMNFLLSAISQPGLAAVERIAPLFRPDDFSNRTTIPPLPPPRARV